MTEILQLIADLCAVGAIIVPFLFLIHSRRFSRSDGPARVGHFTTISYYVEQAYAAPAKGAAIPTYYLMRQNSAWSSILLIYMALFAIFVVRYVFPIGGGLAALVELVVSLLAIAISLRGIRQMSEARTIVFSIFNPKNFYEGAIVELKRLEKDGKIAGDSVTKAIATLEARGSNPTYD